MLLIEWLFELQSSSQSSATLKFLRHRHALLPVAETDLLSGFRLKPCAVNLLLCAYLVAHAVPRVTFKSEVFKMSEIKMLVIAFSTMVAAAVVSLSILHLMQASAVIVLSVTTAAALIAYVSVCLYCLPRLAKPVEEQFCQDDFAGSQAER